MDYQNDEILLEECKEGKQFGFAGKQAIHPSQIDIIQNSFLPDPKGLYTTVLLTGAFNLLIMISDFLLDLERAVRVVEGYEANSQKGVGAFTLDGKM